MSASLRTIVWASRVQTDLVRETIQHADLDLIGIGAESNDHAAHLSASLHAPRVSDLRQAILHKDVQLLWLAAPEPVEADERRLIRELNLRVITTEPQPMTIAGMADDPEAPLTGSFVPLLRRSAGFRAAADYLADPPPQTISIVCAARPEHGSLLARLFDAVDVALRLGGEADTVSAALAGPRYSIPESGGRLHGFLSAAIRFSDGRGATITASDQLGRWWRSVTLLSGGGSLQVTDAGYTWRGPENEKIETGGGGGDEPRPSALIAQQIERLFRQVDQWTERQPDPATVLGVCEAARLSCRTGQSERPRQLLEAIGRPFRDHR